MSNWDTGNPMPSDDLRDFDDNATTFDRLLNGLEASYPDRRGRNRKSWHQMEEDSAALVAPNVAALAALTPAVDRAFFFNSTTPVGMGTYTLTSFVRGLGASVNAAAFRSGIGAMALTDTGAYAGSAAKLGTARSLTITGDGSWTVSFDGSASVSAALALAVTGVAAGTYGAVTVDTKGRVTAAQTATPVANGGTGATAAPAARTALGAAASGVNSDITALNGVSPAWVSLPLNNSWAAQASRRAVYRKVMDWVEFEIAISGGTATDFTVTATFPAGFRPPFQIVFPVTATPATTPSSTVAMPRVIIKPDGTVECVNVTSVAGLNVVGKFSLV